MLAGSVAPLIGVAIGSIAFGNEVEDRTLANLTLSPLPRWQIVRPKLAACIAVAGPFVVGSAFFTSWLAFNHDVTATAAVTASSLVGVMLYSALFLWLGLVTRQAIGVGLAYIVLWEGLFSGSSRESASPASGTTRRHGCTAWTPAASPPMSTSLSAPPSR